MPTWYVNTWYHVVPCTLQILQQQYVLLCCTTRTGLVVQQCSPDSSIIPSIMTNLGAVKTHMINMTAYVFDSTAVSSLS